MVIMKSSKEKKPKTDTIVQRTVNVYLPSMEMRENWKKHADESNQSISKFIIEHVTNSLSYEEDSPSFDNRRKLIENNSKLKVENNRLLKQIREQDSRIEMLEKEARHRVVEPFINSDLELGREYSSALVKLFKKEIEVPKEELYEKLRVNPMDTESVVSIQKQIEILEQFGFLKDIGGLWRWKV